MGIPENESVRDVLAIWAGIDENGGFVAGDEFKSIRHSQRCDIYRYVTTAVALVCEFYEVNFENIEWVKALFCVSVGDDCVFADRLSVRFLALDGRVRDFEIENAFITKLSIHLGEDA